MQFNGQNLDFTDEQGNVVNPKIINNRTMVPMRKIFETFGAKVEWDGTTKTITATKEDTIITLQINNTLAKVTQNGVEREILLDSEPTIVDNRTLVPVRFIAESLDKTVGWDQWDKTVIIIDTSFVEEEIKEKAPNFYAYLNRDFETITKVEMPMEITYKLLTEEYGIENSATFTAKGNTKFDGTNIQLDGTIGVEAEGEDAKESMGEMPESIEGSFIIDMEESKVYLKSDSLSQVEGLENMPNNKWLAITLEDEEAMQLSELMIAMQNQKQSIAEILDSLLTEDVLSTETYWQLQSLVDAVAVIFSNENFTMKEKNGKTIYTFALDNDDLADILYASYNGRLTMETVKETLEDENMSLDLKAEITIEDHVEKGVKVHWELIRKPYSVKTAVLMDMNATIEKYNNDVTITVPQASETVRVEDVYHNPYELNLGGQAQFTGFAEKMSQLRDDVIIAAENAAAEVAIKGLAMKASAQRFNFVARGGNIEEFSGSEENEAKWLPMPEAVKAITEIDKNGQFGSKYLPTIETELVMGKMEASYYVTPKGNVFCWPPYPFGEKSYVNASTSLVDFDGNTVSIGDIATGKSYRIDFTNGESVELTVNLDGTASNMKYIAP